jgi:hypothetical protein
MLNNSDFTAVYLMLSGLPKACPKSELVNTQTYCLVSAVEQGLVCKLDANTLANQFTLPLHWEE